MRLGNGSIEASAEVMLRLRARIEEALAARAAEIYRYASDRLRETGTPLDDLVSVLQEAIPCYGVSVFRVTNAPVFVEPGSAPLLETLPAALADMATDCILARRLPRGLDQLAELCHEAHVAGLGFRPAELTVSVCPHGEAEGLPRAELSITLSPGPAPRVALEAAMRSGDV